MLIFVCLVRFVRFVRFVWIFFFVGGSILMKLQETTPIRRESSLPSEKATLRDPSGGATASTERDESFVELKTRQAQHESALFEAVRATDVAAITRHLDELRALGVHRLNKKTWAGSEGVTPVMKMAARGRLAGIQALWSWGDPEERDLGGWTVFFWAVKRARHDCARWLSTRVDIDTRDNKGRTALHVAIDSENTEMVAWVVNLPGIDLRAVDRNGVSALQCAMEKGERIALIMAQKIGAQTQTADGDTPLIQAAQAGLPGLVSRLLPLSDANHKNKAGRNALMEAARNGRPATLARLIEWPGARIWDADPQGLTALDWALADIGHAGSPWAGTPDCVKMLEAVVPAHLAEELVNRIGREKLPALFARMEAEKIKEAAWGKGAKIGDSGRENHRAEEWPAGAQPKALGAKRV